MEARCIVNLDKGVRFTYRGEDFEVTDTDGYPFIEAKCLTVPNRYEGHNVLFANFETVYTQE